jgi:hypothetical protein
MRFRLLLTIWLVAVLLGRVPPPVNAAVPRQAEEPPPAQPSGFRYPSLFPLAPSVGETFRHIEVSLKQQQLVAYEGKTPVRAFAVSTGAPGTPTPVGHYVIQQKYPKIDLIGTDYYYHDVPYVMLLARPFYIHSASWRKEFGVPASRGCVNLSTDDAAWLFEWTDAGTSVYIHW